MKKLMIAVMLGLSGMFVGCYKYENAHDMDDTWIRHGRGVVTKEITCNGHAYIIINCTQSCNIIHSMSCGCGKWVSIIYPS